MEKDYSELKNDVAVREKEIFKTSIIGILVNLLLVGFKAVIGLISNSIAIILDAVNNLSDALSSVITIIGMKLAGKPADKKHPLGYGRVEYLTSAIISVIVIYAGVTSLTSSVKKIINPEAADYSTVSLIIVGVAVFVKLILGLYVKKAGKRVNSDALVASGTDAFFDAVISASTVIAAIIYLTLGVSLEAWLGVIIAVVIIKSGVEILKETLSKILGERADAELSKGIKETVCGVDGVQGAYDLVINNYGPNTFVASIHIEIPDSMTANEIDEITRKIQHAVLEKHGVFISAVGIYSVNTRDERVIAIKKQVEEIILSFENVLQVHGLYIDENKKLINADFVAGFEAKNPKELRREITGKLQEQFPDYRFDLQIDTDFSD